MPTLWDNFPDKIEQWGHINDKNLELNSFKIKKTETMTCQCCKKKYNFGYTTHKNNTDGIFKCLDCIFSDDFKVVDKKYLKLDDIITDYLIKEFKGVKLEDDSSLQCSACQKIIHKFYFPSEKEGEKLCLMCLDSINGNIITTKQIGWIESFKIFMSFKRSKRKTSKRKTSKRKTSKRKTSKRLTSKGHINCNSKRQKK